TLSFESATAPADNLAPSLLNDGSFRLNVPVGEIRVILKEFPDVYRIASITYGAIDLLTNPIKVSVGDANLFRVKFDFIRPVPFVKLSGHVVGARNTGSASAPFYGFIQFQNDAFLQAPQSPIAADGSFEIPKILPGAYTVAIGPVRPTIVVGEKDMGGLEFIIPPDRQL